MCTNLNENIKQIKRHVYENFDVTILSVKVKYKINYLLFIGNLIK